MAASPMRRKVFLLALMSSRLPGALLSSFAVLLMGRFVFGVSYAISWHLFLPYIIISTVIMMGFGALITLFCHTADSAAQAASVFLTIMVFFSGIYFPREFLPSYFRRVSVFLPLSYIARGLRYTMGGGSMGPVKFLFENMMLLVLSMGLIILVTKRMEWSK